MSWLVDVDLIGSHKFVERPTHKEAQHEAAVVAQEYRTQGREILGSNKEDFYVIEAADPANVITVSIRKID